VIVDVPTGADCEADSINELVPPALIVAGMKVCITFAGIPEVDRVSAPENPPSPAVRIENAVLLPRASDIAVALVDTVNPLTTNVTTTVGAGETPPVPVTVIE
jgi:hypothetical protein